MSGRHGFRIRKPPRCIGAGSQSLRPTSRDPGTHRAPVLTCGSRRQLTPRTGAFAPSKAPAMLESSRARLLRYLLVGDADDVDQHAALARPVELHQEDALPLPQRQLAVEDRDGLARAQEEMLAVCVAVRAFVFVDVD